MNSTDHQKFPLGKFIVAVVCGLFTCLALATILLVLGVATVEAYVFAGLGAVTISCFVWIERSLMEQVREKDRQVGIEITKSHDFQAKLYSRSLACFVRFDAGTLIIDQASPGFIEMLRMPTDSALCGQRLEEVLGVNPLKLESVVESLRQGDLSVKTPKIEILTADGFTTHALINGTYFPDEHIIEAAFFVAPLKNAERVADLEAAQKDLDRFRKGMFRRETRILELKEEVNQLCRKSGLPARYQTDQTSDDSKLELPSSRLDDYDRKEGRVL